MDEGIRILRGFFWTFFKKDNCIDWADIFISEFLFVLITDYNKGKVGKR